MAAPASEPPLLCGGNRGIEHEIESLESELQDLKEEHDQLAEEIGEFDRVSFIQMQEKTTMLKDLSLQELAAKIEANQDLKRDFLADTSVITMQVDGDALPIVEVNGQGRFPVLPLAHDQIGARLQIPAKYYDRR